MALLVVATVLSSSHLCGALWLLLLPERGDLHVEVVVGGSWLSDVSSPRGRCTNRRATEVEGPGAAAALGQGEEVFLLSVADVAHAGRWRRERRRLFPRSPCV